MNRSTIDLETGYSPTRRITLTVASALQVSHGGLQFPLTHDERERTFDFHDRVAKDDFLLLTAGATVSVGRRTAIYGTVLRTFWGRNTHQVVGGTLGLAVSFGGGLGLGGL